MEEQKTLEAALYLVPTPVGNREDITLRGLRVLQQADIIACEDTRHTGQLLKLYEIQPKQLVSCHEHNEAQAAERILHDISQGKTAAFCSDAGSPGISDPGYRLVLKAVEKGIKIIPLPGATAFVPALTALLVREPKLPDGDTAHHGHGGDHETRIIRAIRAHWPQVEILLRADSHYACPDVMDWCETNRLDYVFGLAPKSTLRRHITGLEESTAARFKAAPALKEAIAKFKI